MEQLAASAQSQAEALPMLWNRKAAELSAFDGAGLQMRLPSLSCLLHHWRMSNQIRIQIKAHFEGMAKSQLT